MRHVLVLPEWAAMAAGLGAAPGIALLGLWADPVQAYALLREPDGALLPVSVGVEDGFYPALSPTRPEAAPFERMVRDLWGHGAAGTTDPRALLDHGRWPVTTPLAGRPGAADEPMAAEWPAPPAAAERLERLGPVSGGLRPAEELMLALRGPCILAAGRRGGHAHRGVLALLRGKSPRAAARFAARLAGDATVAHSTAFARAAEAASGAEAPPRAQALRALMAALENLSIALAGLATLAGAAGAPLLAADLAARQNSAMEAAGAAFGHRLMMDCIIPGGVAVELDPGGGRAIEALAAATAAALPGLRRLAAATLAPRIAGLRPARAALRAHLATLAGAAGLPGLLEALPEGPIAASLPIRSGEAIGTAMGPRGLAWHWLRLDGGQIAAAFLCDPDWHVWPRALAALARAAREDADILLAAFGVSAAGVDL
jgi:Ni,Fe-hydrogenase III large subunit